MLRCCCLSWHRIAFQRSQAALMVSGHGSSVMLMRPPSRTFKYKSRSFLSDPEGVNNFIDLLGHKERLLLLGNLQERLDLKTGDPNSKCEPDQHEPPNFKQLRLLFLHQLLPFVGFGFLDNLIMILAGDYIDITIGATLGISTLAAAGLGNALSDVAGIGSAWYVEKIASSVGIEYPKISAFQSDMSRTRWTMHTGRALGVFVGCLLGMVPLFFLPNHSDHKRKEEDTTKVSGDNK